jgi:lactocepin
LKKSWILSGIVLLLIVALVPMGFGAAAASNQTTSKLSFPDDWKVSTEQMQAKQAEKLQALASDRKVSSPLQTKGLPEENSLPTLPNDNVQGNFKADEKGFVSVIIGFSGQPVGTMAGELNATTPNQLTQVQTEHQLAQVQTEHQLAREQLAKLGESVKVTNEMSYAYNGIAVNLPKEKLAEVQALFGMENVHPSHIYYADLNYSVPLVGTTSVWTMSPSGYKGEGLVVGVVDTGVDYNHPDLGGGFGNKVIAKICTADPTDFAAMDLNGHGTHVAGTMAAKAASPNGVTGMAPEAKIIYAKIVKGAEGSAESAWIAAAFDWMLQQKLSGLNLVSINMSFGFDGGWLNPDDPEQVAIQNCVDNGIFVSLSAGNGYYGVYPYNQFYNYGENPSKFTYFPADIGIVGMPSVTSGAMSIAASYNNNSTYWAFKENTTAKVIPYSLGSPSPVPEIVLTKTATYKYVFCGIGASASDFPAAVSGNIALIERGTVTFLVKVQNAMAAGAIAAIIYNNAGGGEAFVSMALDATVTIPSVFIRSSDGLAIKALTSPPANLQFFGGTVVIPITTVDTIVDFSSWGTDPNLNFKPEITAPGGGIWSTVPLAQGGYANYSGTSMASPHVGGAAALIMQAHPDWTPSMVKTALMNTAKVLMSGSLPASPRQQGAGRIQVDKALQTSVFVTDKTTNFAAEPLGDTNSNTSTSFILKVVNTGTATATYNLSGTVQRYGTARTPLTLSGAVMVFLSGTTTITSVTVPGKQTAYVNVAINLAGNTTYENIFVDGFVNFTSTDPTRPALHVPYTIFWGDWQDNRYTADWAHNPVIDPPPDDPTGWSWRGNTWMFDSQGDVLYYLGMDYYGNLDRNVIAISPNGDGVQDNAHPIASFMRGTPDFSYEIHKADGSLLAIAATDQYVPKSFDARPYWSGWDNDWIWAPQPGTVADGSYVARLKAEIPGTFTAGSGLFEAVDFPLIVDTVPPVVKVDANPDVAVAGPGNSNFPIHWTGTDDRSGLWGYQLWLDGAFSTYLPPDATSFTFEGLANGPHAFQVVAFDNAGNVGFSFLSYNGFELTLSAGWNFISFPGQTDPDPQVVLADLPGSYQLKQWDNQTQKWLFNDITFWQGDAYWLMLRQPGSFVFSATMNGDPYFGIPLFAGRNDIGVPYPLVFSWDEVKVSIGGGYETGGPGMLITLEQAFQMRIIRSIFSWNGFTNVNANGSAFIPGKGYQINANMPCQLVFPNPYYNMF